MECPKCHHQNSKVNDSRPADGGAAIRRRRECLNCKHRFSTYERIEQIPLLVIKRDGTREEFSQEKLLRGIVRSAEKRPITMEQMQDWLNKLRTRFARSPTRKLSQNKLGNL